MAKKTLEKNSLLKYFEIYKEKFFKIVILSAIYFTAVTLLLIISMALSNLMFEVLHLNNYLTPVAFLPLIVLGPITAAVIKLCRDFVRGEPSFMAEDFKLAFKRNWKQSTVIAIFQYVVIWVLYIAIPFYYNAMNATKDGESIFFTFGLGISLFVALIFIFMSYYLYMMCVTLTLKIRELFKNAAIFSFLCLLRNILLTIILGAFLALVFTLCLYTIQLKNALLYGIMIMFFMIIFFGFILYTVSFFTFPPIKKYILDPYYEKNPTLTAEGDNTEISPDTDYSNDDINSENSEFVYINGRMVHRSAVNAEKIFSDTAVEKEPEIVDSNEIEKIKSKYNK